MVVVGLKTRSLYLMLWSWSTSRILASVKTLAKGSPVLRATRARTALRFVMELLSVSSTVVIADLGSTGPRERSTLRMLVRTGAVATVEERALELEPSKP